MYLYYNFVHHGANTHFLKAMASDAKFRSVLPNNNMKGDVSFTPVAEIYQEKTNYLGQREDFFWANDIKLSLSGAASSNTVATAMIPPSYKIIGPMFLTFRFHTKDLITAAEFTPFQASCNFAGYNILRQFAYRLPGCDRMYLENFNLPYKHIEDCETSEKVSRLMKLAGQKKENKYWISPAASAEDVSINSSGDGQSVYLTILLPLPWSSPATLGSSRAAKPYPAHLTTQPIELYFMFNDLSNIISNYSATSASGKWTLADTSLSFLYGTFADPAQYKATKYFYATLLPFDHIYPFSLTAAPASGVIPKVDVPLRGLRNGEIREILLHVGDADKSLSDPYSGFEIGNLTLLYAGQKIWST